MADVVSTEPIIGLEVHVELATRGKMFTRASNPAHPEFHDSGPNTLTDAVVLALPGTLPVMNRAAVEMAALVGLALGCTIAPLSRWDRKSYFYPDLPKGYQISQYDLPLCFDGVFELPATDAQGRIDPAGATRRIGIIRAHLEEDAGKLLHEAPGGGAIDFSIVDLNRAGTPLLEIVTAPDFRSADEATAFARLLRQTCRFLGVTEGVMQRGHVRFEPNVNCRLTLRDGRVVHTPIVEVKNLNSFRALHGAISHELTEQPRRWVADGREHGPGEKTTRGWDADRGATYVQREKEDAEDYRYFPDPDLPPVAMGEAWVERLRASLPELPVARVRRYCEGYDLSPAEASQLVEEREVCEFLDAAADGAVERGVARERAGRLAAGFVLQHGARLANERSTLVSRLGGSAEQLAAIVAMRDAGDLGSTAADELLALLCEPAHAGADPRVVAESRGLITVRDDAALDAWCERAIAENPRAAEDVRSGKQAASGRLVGAVMKASGGAADANAARERLIEKLSNG